MHVFKLLNGHLLMTLIGSAFPKYSSSTSTKVATHKCNYTLDLLVLAIIYYALLQKRLGTIDIERHSMWIAMACPINIYS